MSFRTAAALAVLAFLAPALAAAKDVPEHFAAVEGKEKLEFEGFGKRRIDRPLVLATGRAAAEAAGKDAYVFVLGADPKNSASWVSNRSESRGRSGRKFAFPAAGYRIFLAEVNEMLGALDLAAARAHNAAVAKKERLDREISSDESTIEILQNGVDHYKSQDFWWILYIDRVLRDEKRIRELEDEVAEAKADRKGLPGDIDRWHARAWPYTAIRTGSRAGDLIVKFNKKRTRVRVKGKITLEANHRLNADRHYGVYKVDVRGDVAE